MDELTSPPGFSAVLLLALLPAAGNFVGGLAAEAAPVSQRTLSRALHVAAGVLLAVVGLELVPQALTTPDPWIPVSTFVLGGVGFLFLERTIGWVRGRLGAYRPGASAGAPAGAPVGAWAIYAGVAIDLFSDGIMIGTGSTLDLELGALLAAGQLAADLPEGFATIASFQRQGVARPRRLLLAASFTMPIVVGATLGFFTMRGASPLVQVSLLTFTAGILIAVAVEEMIPEAHEGGEPRFGPVALVAGFALFVLLAAYAR